MAPSSRGSGVRAFANWDEDAVTMAVEAGRGCVSLAHRSSVRSLTCVSTTFPYADLQNSSIVAGALGLSAHTKTTDVAGSQRAATSAMVTAFESEQPGALLIASDRPHAKIASSQEMTYGAGSAAIMFGSDAIVAKLLGTCSVTALFVDHFRPSGTHYDYFWEERWIRDEGILKLVPAAITPTLSKANVSVQELDWLVMPSLLRGSSDAVAKQIGFKGKVARALDENCGYCGAAQILLMLVDTLAQAKAGERILVVGFGQGADVLVLETTEAIENANGRGCVQAVLDDQIVTDDYMRMLAHYGEIDVDWGMRAEMGTKAILTEQYRSANQLLAFNAAKCGACGTIQFPQLAYCVNPECNVPKTSFSDFPLADQPVKIMTFTADWLSYYPGPPLYVGFVEFDAGCRLLMEMVDVGPQGLQADMPVEPVFRIKEPDIARGFNRYFWKVRPKRA